MSTTRRQILQGSAAGAVLATGVLAPRDARAESDRLVAFAREQRRRQRIARVETLALQRRDRPEGGAEAVHLDLIARGMAAFGTVRALQDLSLREQSHPAVQELLEDVAVDVGGALESCHELFEAFLACDAPDKAEQLRASLGRIRETVPSWSASAARKHQLVRDLLRLERTRRPGALERKVARLSRRLGRMRAVAPRLAETPSQGGQLIEDPVQLAEIEAGRQAWAGLGPLPSLRTRSIHSRRQRPPRKALGVLVLVLGILIGGLIFLVGFCAVTCGAASGLIGMMLGAGIIVGAIFWARSLRNGSEGHDDHPGDHPGDHPDEAEPDVAGSAEGQALMGERVCLTVPAAGAWLPTGLDRQATGYLLVEGQGRVRLGSFSASAADGQEEAAGQGALVPEAPLGALVGRVGEDTFFLGAEARVPEGPAGTLYLAVNRRLDAPEAPRGSLQVAVTAYSWPAA